MFKKALPVFPKGLSNVMNVSAVFKCSLPARQDVAQLRITGATRYRVYFNDELLIYGPARAAGGYFRVDELPLELINGGELRIELSSYNCRSFDGVTHPGFIMAEVECGGEILASTGHDFEGYINESRLRKVMRFSYQRHFSEVYDGQNNLKKCELELMPFDFKPIPREVPLPCMEILPAKQLAARGMFTIGEGQTPNGRFIINVTGDANGCPIARPESAPKPHAEKSKMPSDGYALDELEAAPYLDYIAMQFKGERISEPFVQIELGAGEYAMADYGRAHTGFLRADVDVEEDAYLIISYEEYCPDAWVPTNRLAGQYIHMVSYKLKAGHYNLENFDPVDFRYMQFNVVSGRVIVNSASLRTFVHPECARPALDSGDKLLDEIYGAAVETYRQNALDVYMDCPTRERAGWLCDSYYTAQSEFAFTGDNRIERQFLRNFVQAGAIKELPVGMLPMCYPSDVLNSEFIPQWAMWYVLELESALKRDPGMDKEYFRKLCYDLLNMLAKYRNSDGLLEDLPGWNFVEWSKCNTWTNDVNYPTNFLYSRILKAVGNIYGDNALIEQCAQVRKATVRLSFDGQLFEDNAVRGEDGVLRNTGNTSETCQYYALRFGEIDIDEPQYAFLKSAFTNIFGPDHSKYAELGREIEPSNAFMGIYLRIESLLALGMNAKVLEEIKSFFGGMAKLTGTLWEHNDVQRGSLNHGFASFAAVAILRALGRE